MKMISGNVHSPQVFGKPEADEGPANVLQIEGRLGLHHLHQARVGGGLPGNAAGPDHGKGSRNAKGIAEVPGGQGPVQALFQFFVGKRLFQGEGPVRVKEGHDGEGGARGILHRVGRAVGFYLEEPGVEGDHLAVQGVEGAQAGVAVFSQFSEGGFPVIDPFHEGVDGRGLEDGVLWGLGMSAGGQERRGQEAEYA